MKAILKFNLPEEQPEFDLAVNGYKWQLVVWDLNQYLRAHTKYAPDDMSDSTYEALESVRMELFNILNKHKLELD